MPVRLTGLIAATYTPMHDDGSLNLGLVPRLVGHLTAGGVAGLYVCGSTGEGVSLTSEERRAVAEAFIDAAGHRVPVVVQVGHNSLAEARGLAEHAASAGADAVSAVAPSYYGIGSVETLVECMAEIAAGAPGLPFYYYHIPALTGLALDVVEFLRRAGDRIPNLAGLKYTTPEVHVYQSCLELDHGRFDVLWGTDEMLMAALTVGCRGAVGSTYNVAAPVYRRIVDAFEAGDLATARSLQSWAVTMVRTIYRYPFHPAMKHVLGMLGLPCGPCRLPQGRLTADQARQLCADLEACGFLKMVQVPAS